jgi:transcriptional regulator with XRE-family HTH domain
VKNAPRQRRASELAEELQPELRRAETTLKKRRRANRAPTAVDEGRLAQARADYPPARPPAEMVALCLKLRSTRHRKQLTLGDVAERTGMDAGTISRLENGRLPNPTLSTLQRYAASIGMRLALEVHETDEHETAPSPDTAGPEYPVRSIHEESAQEALREKWSRSEAEGRDLGRAAIRDWINRHWHGFVRARWLEHLEGKTFWIEVDTGDFGLLKRAFQGSPYLDEVVDQLKRGGENLSILQWAAENNHPFDEIVAILQEIDVNRIRIQHELDNLS